MAVPGASMTSMRYVDFGYAIARDDIKTSITWDQLEAHLYAGNYFELLNKYNNSQFSFPYETEVELGDSVIVMTNRYFISGNSFTTRVARFGDFAYASDGRMLSANIYREYYMHEASGDLWGDVLDYGEDGYLISDMLTIDEEEKHGEYKRDNIEALQVHAFDNDEDYLGRGRSAFQEDEASKYFRDDWHLDPFGNNFVSVETGSKNLILQYKGNEYLLGTVFGTFSELKDVLVDDPWWHQNQDTSQGFSGPDELVNQVIINADREWFDVSNDLSYDNYYSQYGGGNDLPVFAALHSNQQSTVGVKWLHDQGHVIGDNAQLGAEHYYLTSTLLGRIGSFVEGEGDKVFHVNSKPSGLPLHTGNFTVGQRIALDTSEIDDADNSEGWAPSYEYSWEVSGDNGTTWTELTSTDATDGDNFYTLTPAEAGKQLRGVVGYRDGYGTTELIKALALTVNALPEPVTQNIDLWVSAGSFEAPYYRFYVDAEGNQELTSPVLDTSKSYTFRRLNEATSHPFYISDTGFKQSSSDALLITGDGSPFQGITGNESLKVEFTDLPATTEELLYYCSSHSSMQRTLDLIDGSTETFQVTDVRQIASGLALKLTEAPDLEKLNLYDGADASIDLPDLQLTRSNGTVVDDLSLHWEEETNELFLIQTDSLTGISKKQFAAGASPFQSDRLVEGDYELVIDARSDGLISASSGELIDGNGDGIMGDTFAYYFTKTTAENVISIGDTTRGSGQSLGLNGIAHSNGINGLPVLVSTTAEIRSISGNVSYDSTAFDNVSLVVGHDLPDDWTLDTQENDVGLLNYTASGTTAITGTDQELFRFDAVISEDAAYGSSTLIEATIEIPEDPDLNFESDPSLVVLAYSGDTTGNRGHSSLDASRIQRVVVGLDSGFDSYDTLAPTLIGDTTGNGGLSSLDASRVQQEVVGLPVDTFPSIPLA